MVNKTKKQKSKVIKTVKNSKTEWFDSRKYGKSEITAKRNSKDNTGKPKLFETDKKVKTRNIDVVERVMTEANGKIPMKEAISKAKELKTLRSSRPDFAWELAFRQAPMFGVNTKVTKENDELYVELA